MTWNESPLSATSSLPWERGFSSWNLRVGVNSHTIPESFFEVSEHTWGVVILDIKDECNPNLGADIVPFSGNIVIPPTINWQPVVEIRACVFENLPVTEVQIPATVVSIWERAFKDCRHLRTVHFPKWHPVFCGDMAFENTQLFWKMEGLLAVVPDGAAPFPSGCVFEQAIFEQSRSVKNIAETTRDNIQHQLPIGMAPSTYPSYYPPTNQ